MRKALCPAWDLHGQKREMTSSSCHLTSTGVCVHTHTLNSYPGVVVGSMSNLSTGGLKQEGLKFKGNFEVYYEILSQENSSNNAELPCKSAIYSTLGYLPKRSKSTSPHKKVCMNVHSSSDIHKMLRPTLPLPCYSS